MSSEITVTKDTQEELRSEIVDRVEYLVDRIRKCEQDKLMFLLEIYKDQLWRANYRSFEEFCRQRLGYSKQYVYRCVNAGKMLEAGIPVENPNQSLALEGLDIEKAKEVWDRAEESAAEKGGKISGGLLKKARKETELIDRAQSDEIDIKSLQAPFVEIISTLRQAKDLLHDLCQQNDAAWISYQSIGVHLREAAGELKIGMPDSVCGSCGGKGCETCLELGWLPKAKVSAQE